MRFLVRWLPICLLLAGCNDVFSPGHPGPVPQPPPLPSPDPPENAIQRLIGACEQKKTPEYLGMLTGDFTYELSTSSDPTLVQLYATGWFKNDEKESATHLFNGYTPPGGATLPAATTIDINLAVDLPADDNTAGLDPITHKVLATRVDGYVTFPQSGSSPITYVISNNYHVFYLVRGDQAVNLDSTQPADMHHWYVYRWVDLTEAQSHSDSMTVHYATWTQIKARYR